MSYVRKWTAGLLTGALLLAMPAMSGAQLAPAPPAVDNGDPNARFVVASGRIKSEDGWQLQLLVSDGQAAMRARPSADAAWQYQGLPDSPQIVLRMLADKRIDFMWPALLDWAGSDLGLMRARMAARADKLIAERTTGSARNTVESTARNSTRALLQAANLLRDTGYGQRAIDLMRANRKPKMPKKGVAQSEWAGLIMRQANIMVIYGRSEEAIALLASMTAQIGATDPLAVNFEINRAAYLANLGRYADALRVLDAAQAAMAAAPQPDDLETVAGSDRQFAWIRACALNGLGRSSEAQPFIDLVRSAPEPTGGFFLAEDNDRVDDRLMWCMRDVSRLVDKMSGQANDSKMGPRAYLAMQPDADWPIDSGHILPQVRANPKMIAAIKWMRVLPPEFRPALRNWRE